jgi:curved DNA-binding protein CbpA
MSEDLCPRKILGVPKNYTIEELKRQYKKMVLKMHPDMKSVSDISSTANFQILTTCYKVLVQELEKKDNDKDFSNLKKECQSYSKTQEKVVHKSIDPSESFNVDKFNKLFSKSRVSNPYDKGYDDWMEKNKDIKNDGSIIKYKEPEPSVSSSLGGFLLGVEQISDFSGGNMTDKSLNFMDYRVAYTTPTIEKNIDKMSKRKDYKNLEALEKDRSKIKFEPDTKMITDLEKRKRYEQLKENVRLENIKKRDELISENFNKSNGAFIQLR